MSRIPTPAPPDALVVASSLVFAFAVIPATAPSSDTELFKQFMKAYLEAQVLALIAPEIEPEPCEQSFKAQFSDLFYGILHIDCYWFYHQYKNYFETAGAQGPNKILFEALFLGGSVTQQ